MVKVLDSGLWGQEFDTHAIHGSLLQLSPFCSPQFAPYTQREYAVNEYRHCWEGTYDGLASCPGQSV